MPKFDLFSFFKKYPLLAMIILAGLALYTGSKLTHEAQVEGILPGLQIMEATVVDSYSQEIRTRRLRTTEGCFVQSQNDEGRYDTRINCDDRNQYEVGSTIELLKDGSTVESLSMAKGHFVIDLLLFVAEIFGIFYYFRLSRNKVPALA